MDGRDQNPSNFFMSSKIAILNSNPKKLILDFELLESLSNFQNGPCAEYDLIGWKELAMGHHYDLFITAVDDNDINILKRLGEFSPLSGPIVVLTSNPTNLQKKI